MATTETHQEVTKVWIAPGCIVCDSCESDCPEVFDVQEETCVIRPEAQKPDFTKPLTPSIIVAAEGCPVDVIKYETVEVEGPEPWAGQEQEAVGAGAPAGGAAKPGPKKTGWQPPEGPPDPKWAGLLEAAHTSGSRSAGGPAVQVKAARAPAHAIRRALPPNAPPDALAAAMVGSGFTRPRPSVVDRIRQRTGGLSRREFGIITGVSAAVAVAWGAMIATAATFGAALQSFLVPKVTKEPPSPVRVGRLGDFADPGVYEEYKPQGVWLVHLPDGKLVALSTTCTHLGCIPNWLAVDSKFKCPCHGSGFYVSGVNFEGPAPRPLERIKIGIENEFVVVDKSIKFRQELGQWGLPGSEITV